MAVAALYSIRSIKACQIFDFVVEMASSLISSGRGDEVPRCAKDEAEHRGRSTPELYVVFHEQLSAVFYMFYCIILYLIISYLSFIYVCSHFADQLALWLSSMRSWEVRILWYFGTS